MNNDFKYIEKYAEEHNIPIMEKTGINFLTKYIKENNIKNILEIGSAIGYSAIKMALVDEKIKITTIEKNDSRYLEALKNIKNFNLEKQITLVLADALDIELSEQYDLIFIDAAKGQYLVFLENAIRLAKNGAVIIADNVYFHGRVLSGYNEHRHRTATNRLREYIRIISEDKRLKSTVLNVGDGVAISVVNKEIK